VRTIDLHAHLTPQCFQREVRAGKTWHGMTGAEGELHSPMNGWTPEQRLADMDSLGIDVQVVSTNVAFYKYDQDVSTTTAIARACNDEVHQMTLDRPDRFAGLATLPMQDIPAAVAELEEKELILWKNLEQLLAL
jgi:aminocarboxymuconate-semialdehyde decarboxylase